MNSFKPDSPYCCGGLSLACQYWIFYQLATIPSHSRSHENLVSPEWSRCNGKQAVTHIWNGTPSSLLKVWPIKPRMNHSP